MVRMYFIVAATFLFQSVSAEQFVPSSELKNKAQSVCKDLRKTPQSELDAMYAGGFVGEIPDGPTVGCVIGMPGQLLNEATAEFLNRFWLGKVFNKETGRLMNNVLGRMDFEAKVFPGKSWFDAKQSIVIDYHETNVLISSVRDEIREIQPGFYLGRMYQRTLFGNRFAINFALFL